MDIQDFAGKGPEFLPERFLVGALEGWGVLEGPLGALKALRWSIRKLGVGKYEGTEPKVEGVADGEQAGFVYHWSYTRETPQQGGEPVTLNFDDWFYLIDARTCIVRGTAGRLGLPFAVAYVTYRKV